MTEWVNTLCVQLKEKGYSQATGYPLFSLSQYDKVEVRLGQHTRVLAVSKCTDVYDMLIQVWLREDADYLVHVSTYRAGAMVSHDDTFHEVHEDDVVTVVLGYI